MQWGLIVAQESSALLLGLSGHVVYPEIYSLWCAMPVAMENVRARGVLRNYTLNYTFQDDGCTEGTGINAVYVLVKERHVDAIVGSGCSAACRGGGKIASVWNTPVIAYGCDDHLLSDKQVYSTFIRTVGLSSTTTNVITLIHHVMGWSKLCVVERAAEGHAHAPGEVLKTELPNKNVTLIHPLYTYEEPNHHHEEHDDDHNEHEEHEEDAEHVEEEHEDEEKDEEHEEEEEEEDHEETEKFKRQEFRRVLSKMKWNCRGELGSIFFFHQGNS